MSTDWGIGCRDCASPRDEHGERSRGVARSYFTGEWDNCRDVGALQTLCAAAAEIVAADNKAGRYLIVTWKGHVDDFGGGCHGVAAFMREHCGHRLAPMSEYLLFHDESFP
jgi:hypothetical protein